MSNFSHNGDSEMKFCDMISKSIHHQSSWKHYSTGFPGTVCWQINQLLATLFACSPNRQI